MLIYYALWSESAKQRIYNKPTRMRESLITRDYYFLVNTKSGSHQGKRIVSIAPQALTRPLTRPSSVRVHMVDLFDPHALSTALDSLQQADDGSQTPRVIICGGDGTIHWVVNEMIRQQIDMRKVVVGVLPIGTGNDFCRSIGWDPDKSDLSAKGISRRLEQWEEAQLGKYDLWDVAVHTYRDGRIYDVKDRQEIARQERSFKRVFTNYTGMGLDARVVYTMEKNRTQWPLINKICYALVGCLNCLWPMRQLTRVVSSFTQNNQGRVALAQHPLQYQLSSDITAQQSQPSSSRGESGELGFKKGYKGVVCLNSSSYMAGLRHVWETTSIAVQRPHRQKYEQQRVDDGMVEFVAYKNEIGLGLERVMRTGAKVCQGTGPFEIAMRPPLGEEVTHLQIDGEAIKVVNLKTVRISRTSQVPGSQLTVLVGTE